MEGFPRDNAHVETINASGTDKMEGALHGDDPSPHNPLYWSLGRKLTIMGVMGVWIFLGTTNIVIINPALSIIPAEFNSSFATVTYLPSGPLLAYGIASFFWVPLANRFGTRLVHVSGSIMAACFCVWAAKASSFGTLVAARTLASIAFAPPETLAPQMVGDLWSIKHRATALTWIAILQASGFAGGSIVGGLIIGDESLGWRWAEWILAIVTGTTAVALFFFYPETQYTTSTEIGRHMMNSRCSKDFLRFWAVSGGGQAKSPSLRQGFLSLAPYFVQPLVMLSTTFISIILMATTYLMTTQSLVYPILYGFNTRLTGATYVANILGTWIAMLFCGTFADWWYLRGSHNVTEIRPERRLHLLLVTSITGIIGLPVFGVCIQQHSGWFPPLVGAFFMSFCFISSLSITFQYLLDIFGERMDAVMTVFNGCKNLAAFAIGYAVVPWNDNDGYTIPFVVLMALVIVAHIVMVVCYFAGPPLRSQVIIQPESPTAQQAHHGIHIKSCG